MFNVNDLQMECGVVFLRTMMVLMLLQAPCRSASRNEDERNVLKEANGLLNRGLANLVRGNTWSHLCLTFHRPYQCTRESHDGTAKAAMHFLGWVIALCISRKLIERFKHLIEPLNLNRQLLKQELLLQLPYYRVMIQVVRFPTSGELCL
jgi:hypothetical protein